MSDPLSCVGFRESVLSSAEANLLRRSIFSRCQFPFPCTMAAPHEFEILQTSTVVFFLLDRAFSTYARKRRRAPAPEDHNRCQQRWRIVVVPAIERFRC